LGEEFVTDTMAPVLVNDSIQLAIDNPPGNFEDIYNLLQGTGPEDEPAGSYLMTKVGLHLFSYLESSYM
jgi:hypothetical protein